MSLSWVTGKDSRQRRELSVSRQTGKLSCWQTDVLGSSACHRYGRGEVVGKETSGLHVPRFWSSVMWSLSMRFETV